MKCSKNDPVLLLERIARATNIGKALDLGPGDGNEMKKLAKIGYNVEGVDIDERSVDTINRYAKKSGYKIKAYFNKIEDFDLKLNYYSLIYSIGSFNFISYDEQKKIAIKIKNSLKSEGRLFIASFSRKDIFFKVNKNKKNIYCPSKEELKEMFGYLKNLSVKKVCFEEDHNGKVVKHKHIALIVTGKK